MNTNLFSLPLLEPIMNGSYYKPSYKLKSSKTQKIIEHFKLSSSDGDRISRVFESSTPESFNLNYRITQLKSAIYSPVIDIELTPQTVAVLSLNPGDVRPSEDCLDVITAAIATMGGFHYLKHSDYISLNLIILDCFNSINDRFPTKIDLLISLKESNFPMTFIENLEKWDFHYDFRITAFNKLFSDLLSVAKQGQVTKTFYQSSIASVLVHEELINGLFKHWQQIGYFLTPTDSGELTVSWTILYQSNNNSFPNVGKKLKELLK